MKRRIIVVILILFFSLTVYGDEKEAPSTMRICKAVSEIAREVMKARQYGISMSKMMEAIGDDKLSRKIIIMAFEEPMYNSEKYQNQAISEFENAWFSICIKNFEE